MLYLTLPRTLQLHSTSTATLAIEHGSNLTPQLGRLLSFHFEETLMTGLLRLPHGPTRVV